MVLIAIVSRDLTGRISVATTQVRLPRPRLKAVVKIISRGSGSQEMVPSPPSGEPLSVVRLSSWARAVNDLREVSQ